MKGKNIKNNQLQTIKMAAGLKSKNVVIHNSITRSAQGLSLAEKRILFSGIAKLGGISGEVKLTAKDYADTFDLDADTAYTQLKTAVDRLERRSISWQVQDGKAIGRLSTIWVQGYKYFDKEGYIKFKFSDYLFPYLFELQQEFTKYQLKQAAALRSLHSWRLLELFEQMKGNKKDGWLSIDIEDFHHAMESKTSYRNNFNLLKKRVIEPAIKELMSKDNWLIEWRTVKKGRKVTMIEFYFERSPQGDLFKE